MHRRRAAAHDLAAQPGSVGANVGDREEGPALETVTMTQGDWLEKGN